MSTIDNTIQQLEKLRASIIGAKNGEYEKNREIFNELKTLLIENGFDIDIITIDHNDKFFTPPQDFERTFGNPDEKFKDHQGILAALCTKAIRDLKVIQSRLNNPTQESETKTIVKTETVYPPTAWRHLRNGLFWTIILGLFSIGCLAFYNLGQNSKEKENAELVNEISEKKAAIKELEKKLEFINGQLQNLENEKINLIEKLDESNNKSGEVNKFVTRHKVSNYTANNSKDFNPTSGSSIVGKNVNTGTNNGVIGDNTTINAPLQPHPTTEMVQSFIEDYPDKNSKLKFMYRSDSRMSNIYANELIELLRKAGYDSIGWEIDISNSMRAEKRGIHLVEDKGDGIIRYFVQVEG